MTKQHPPAADRARRIKTDVKGAHLLTLEKIGVSRFDLGDPYHLALEMTWPQFFAGLIVVYLAINIFFALLYFLVPGSVVNLPAYSLLDAFFFSIETLATVGYGNMAPVTLYAHVVSTVEIFVGMVLTATMTGLVFVRFSRPKAKLIFASRAVVTRNGNEVQLMVRIGNGRLYALNDAQARMTTLVASTAPNGQASRRLADIPLVRAEMPFFPLTWTIIHRVTADSPLAGLRDIDADGLATSGLRLMLSITARDPALGAQVHASHAYGPDDIALDMRYADAVVGKGDGHSVADMRKISDVEANG